MFSWFDQKDGHRSRLICAFVFMASIVVNRVQGLAVEGGDLASEIGIRFAVALQKTLLEHAVGLHDIADLVVVNAQVKKQMVFGSRQPEAPAVVLQAKPAGRLAANPRAGVRAATAPLAKT